MLRNRGFKNGISALVILKTMSRATNSTLALRQSHLDYVYPAQCDLRSNQLWREMLTSVASLHSPGSIQRAQTSCTSLHANQTTCLRDLPRVIVGSLPNKGLDAFSVRPPDEKRVEVASAESNAACIQLLRTLNSCRNVQFIFLFKMPKFMLQIISERRKVQSFET